MFELSGLILLSLSTYWDLFLSFIKGDSGLFIVLFLYTIACLFIIGFCVGQLHLLWLYFRRPALPPRPALPANEADYPYVTVQLPMYNEKYVAAAVIDACASLRYPKNRLEIQVLDDSTDETRAIVAERAAFWKTQGIDVTVIHRTDRKGYKAGALAHGTPLAKGELLAIFDADFRPHADFLELSVPYFSDAGVGFVQGRWGHLNRNYNLLTIAQSVMIDAFFMVEQLARARHGLFIRFNGSAGMWRKSCIESSGGWHADTLSEDLDLCLRAQTSGWTAVYDENIVAPAELPVTIHDYKVQQYRWTKGRGQVIRKLLKLVTFAKVPPLVKFHAVFDLLNVFIIPGVFLMAFLSPWYFYIAPGLNSTFMETLLRTSQISVVLFPAISWLAIRAVFPDLKEAIREFIKSIPAFFFVVVGLSFMLCIALVDGFFNKDSEFKRTSKYNILTKSDSWTSTIYSPKEISKVTLLEGLLAFFFLFAVYLDLRFFWISLILWHFSNAAGYAYIFLTSIRRA